MPIPEQKQAQQDEVFRVVMVIFKLGSMAAMKASASNEKREKISGTFQCEKDKHSY